MSPPKIAHARDISSRIDIALSAMAVAACLIVIAYKFFVAGRINVNWDEFYYLNFVHAHARGELGILLQGAFVHLFGWLPRISGDEMDQVLAARWVMVALLGTTSVLIWLFGRTWLSGSASFAPPFVYLTAIPVLLHGGSFRSDSLLAPLLMGALVLIVLRTRTIRTDLLAGVFLGAAFAITVKVILFAPVVAGLLLFRSTQVAGTVRRWPREPAIAALAIAVAAATVAALLLYLHWLTIPAGSHEPVAQFGARAARKTLLDVPWFAQARFLTLYLDWQPLAWTLIGLGAAAASIRRRWDLLVLALALLPIAVYRNAFAYFYIVMLAPLSVLAGFAIQEMSGFVARQANTSLAGLLTVIVWLGVIHQGTLHLGRFMQDGQVNQRALVAATHKVFPEPVNYIDRCGMISSYRKVNPFMSTWGMETYRDRGVPFMPKAIAESKPAFVLVNTVALNSAYAGRNSLLAEDAEAIQRFYPTYWGPLRVAGARTVLDGSTATRVMVPFPERYRLFSPTPIVIDGTMRKPGDVFLVGDQGALLQLPDADRVEGRTEVALFLAAAHPPPRVQLPNTPIFDGL